LRPAGAPVGGVRGEDVARPELAAVRMARELHGDA